MDANGKLLLLKDEKRAIQDLTEPLRQEIVRLQQRIVEIEGLRSREVDEHIAALIELIDLGLDKDIVASVEAPDLGLDRVA